MSRRRRGRGLLVAALALVAALGGLPAAAVLPDAGPLAAPDALAATGLTMTADARYVVDPAKKRVRVSVALVARNNRTDTKTRRFYYDRAFLAVQPGTTAFRISSSGARPSVRVQRRTSTYTLLRIDFGAQLAAGATRRFTLTFDIVDPGGAPTRAIRIGTSLVSFGAWGFGTAGTPGGTVTVTFPSGYSIDVEAAGLGAPTTDGAGNVVYATGRLADALSFFAYFVADRPGDYRETTIQVPIGGRTVPITIRAWPDDPAWAKRVGGLLTRGLPALADEIGLPWPFEQPLVVEEAISRTAAGFAGRYDPQAGRVEIAYYATPYVVLHEAAHAWFDGGLLADRWATEGFASYYAVKAAAATGEKKVTGDVLTPALEKIRVPLNAWGPAGSGDAALEDAEYAAAHKLATLVATRAGTDGLTAVWQAIHERRAAYQPVGSQAALETADGAPDWRALLDLLEERTGASYDDLWRQWVVRPTEAALLADRAAARTRYAEVTERAGAWRLPRIVRDALRAWQFDQAVELLDGADRALDAREDVETTAAALDLTPPTTLRTAFEGPHGFAAATAEADAELAALGMYREALAARSAEPGTLARIGLWGSDPGAALERAAAAFAAGDLQASADAATLATYLWQGAPDVGRSRLLSIAAIVAALLLGAFLARRWRRDRRQRRGGLAVGRG